MHSPHVGTPQYQQNTIQSQTVFFLCCIRLSIHKVSIHTPPKYAACKTLWVNLKFEVCAFLWSGQTFTEKAVTGQQLCKYAKMYLAMEIQHKDFNHHCKDFKAKEWHAFEF